VKENVKMNFTAEQRLCDLRGKNVSIKSFPGLGNSKAQIFIPLKPSFEYIPNIIFNLGLTNQNFTG
jgi:hypothetical protein